MIWHDFYLTCQNLHVQFSAAVAELDGLVEHHRPSNKWMPILNWHLLHQQRAKKSSTMSVLLVFCKHPVLLPSNSPQNWAPWAASSVTLSSQAGDQQQPFQHSMGTLKLQCKALSELGFLGVYSLLKWLQGKKTLPYTNRSFRGWDFPVAPGQLSLHSSCISDSMGLPILLFTHPSSVLTVCYTQCMCQDLRPPLPYQARAPRAVPEMKHQQLCWFFNQEACSWHKSQATTRHNCEAITY